MKPDVKEYLNIFQFLQDCYQYRKATAPRFSFATWSAELGIKNKSYLRFVILGKRPLNDSLMEKLKINLQLPDNEKKIFELLCHYTQSSNDERRRILGKELLKHLKTTAEQVEINAHHEMLMNPLTMMIRTLLTFQDIPKNSASLAEILDQPVEEIRSALEVLKTLGLVEEKNGEFLSAHQNLRIADRFHAWGLENFYKKSFQRVIDAINAPKDTRKFRSWFVALNEEEFQRFSMDSESDLRERILQLETDTYQGKKLYQVLLTTNTVTKI